MINKTLLGCIFYIVAMLLSVSSNVLVKKTMIDFNLPAWESIAIRQTIIVVILAPFMVKEKFNFFNKKTLGINLLRNIIYALSIGLAHIALFSIPINTGTSVQFVTPILATILAIFFLKEKSSFYKWFSLIVCICGAVYIQYPFGRDVNLNIAYLLLAISVLLKSINSILTRILALNFNTSTCVFYMHIIILFVSLCFFPSFVFAPLLVWIILGIVGVIYLTEYILIYKAQKYCSVSVLQPLDFSKIIHAIILSNLVLGEVLTLKQIIGCCVILLGLVVMLFDKNHNSIKK